MSDTGHVAIVGSGLAGFTVYAAVRHAGIDDVVVFGDQSDPAATWKERAAAIRQREMRSESAGHCSPTTFPGLAVRAALRRRSPRPLAESLGDRYHPSVGEFLEHVDELRTRLRWDDAVCEARIERVRATESGFELDGHGVFRHVLLAPGHPGLNVPDELSGDPRVVHSYEPHDYARTVTVVGAGLAAATEWLNALAAGAEVVSVRRREPLRRPLNVPRPFLSKRGLAGYHRLHPRERHALLTQLLAPSYPRGRAWDEPIERATQEGRFRVEPSVNGSEQIICATGFRSGYEHNALLQRLVDEHGLATAGSWIALAPDSTVPGLTDETRTLAIGGVPAQWAFPAADTLMGARYAGHGFVRRVKACPTR